ncbi:MgtC/SapB family protein [Neobacillus notoginsengisoli]|uniref:MgtC/SapB family protein n=1 Tax=Neobacillus notoginsengisoli TaxID=1578198 RepID=A0A417YXR6_9BACI|nr:MgtC/SapB family protein [Neobacillus notoginsengisoli]RHW42536.1 MgtC/SapB family protein [Neobacillus notoginsengisoli]
MSAFETEIFLKLGISAVLGLVIGLERELKRKPVGLKTSLVICIVSCLLTIVSMKSAYNAVPGAVNITMDPLRLAAQIVSGIGFLGAGVILRRENDSISGLTTAAIIWGAAGIGIAVGAGFYLESFAGVALLIFSVEFLPFIIKMIGPKQLREKEILLQLHVAEREKIDSLIDFISEQKYILRKVRIKDLRDGDHHVHLQIGVDSRLKTTEVYNLISDLPGVQRVEIESIS